MSLKLQKLKKRQNNVIKKSCQETLTAFSSYGERKYVAPKIANEISSAFFQTLKIEEIFQNDTNKKLTI